MLRLRSLRFRQLHHESESESWSYDWPIISDLAMIVGINATGKSRLLSSIKGLAKTLTGLQISGAEVCQAVFQGEVDGKHSIYTYLISRKNGIVIEEQLLINDEKRIVRRFDPDTLDRTNKIYSPALEEAGVSPWVNFGIDDNQIAVKAKRDSIQYPFLEPLIEWAENVEFFSFTAEGSGFQVLIPMGGNFDFVAQRKSDIGLIPLAGYYMEAMRRNDQEFPSFVVDSMNAIGFDILTCTVQPTQAPQMGGGGAAFAVAVMEKGRAVPTLQTEMSSGMVRALAAIMKLRTAQEGTIGTLLLDDIGEGMDYSRSVKLINFLLEEARMSDIQLIMTTNDRFVMNEVPLEHWVILERNDGVVGVRDKNSDQELFDKYERLGLSNFDLFRATTSGKKNAPKH